MPSRWRVRRIFGPLVKAIAKLGVKVKMKPNHATWLMLVVAILSGTVLVLTRLVWLFGILVFITGLMDGVDGSIARMRGMATPSGGFLDSCLDRISEIVLFGSVYLFYDPLSGIYWNIVKFCVFLAFFGSLMVSYTRARAGNEKIPDLDIGLMGRSERLFTLVIFAVLSPVVFYFNKEFDLFSVGIIILAITTNLTVVYRVASYKKQLEKA